jgi:hypothetical protein
VTDASLQGDRVPLCALLSSQPKQDLAVIAHLCGAGPATSFARGGFQLGGDERCGGHDVAAYLARGA